jgi:hypothetical protein
MGDDKAMDTEGDKWDFTASVDHLHKTADTNYVTDKLYQRAWTQLGNKESVSKLKTTITFVSESSVVKAKVKDATLAEVQAVDSSITELPVGADKYYTLDASGTEKMAVVGFLFDLHKTKNSANKTVYDFILIGIRPSTREYYIDRYYNVPDGVMEKATSLSDLWDNAETYHESLDGKASTAAYVATPIPENKFTKGEDENGNETLSFDLTLTQANGKYTVSFCGITKEINTTTRTAAAEDKDGVIRGGAGVYSNAPLGTIAKIQSVVDKDNTEGLYEEVE